MAHSTPLFRRSDKFRRSVGIRTTPYVTPRSKASKWTQEELVSNKDDAIYLSELVQKTWSTYKATPLFNFSYNNNQLKKYSHMLAVKFEVVKAKHLGLLVGSEAKFHGEFSVLPGVAFAEDKDEALKIRVIAMDKSGNSREVFCGILCSVKGNEKTECLSGKEPCTVLPVLLTKGGVAFTECVIKFLEVNFSCYVSPMRFSSFELAWQVSMWAVSDKNDGKGKHLQLVYALPGKKLNTVEYDISADTIKMVWKRIHDSDSKHVLLKEVNQFIDALNNHFYHLFGIKVDNFPLIKVTTQAAAVHSSGKLKIMTTDSVHQVLHHLTTLAQEYLCP